MRALQRAHMLRALDKLPDSAPREALQALVRQADGDLLRTRALFEDWYNDAMDRVSGWYKHRTQIILFALGLSTAMLVNVDSIAVGRALWNTPAVRSYAMAQAEKYAQPNADAGAGKAEERVKELESLTLPVGWDAHWQDTPNWKRGHWMALLGWLMTAFAVTLGSPFWFDVLNRFMVVRSTVKPQEKSAVEAPKDPTVAGGASEG